MTPNSLETVPLEALWAVMGGVRQCNQLNQADRDAAIHAKIDAGMTPQQAEFKTPTVRQAINRCALKLNPWDTSKDPHVPAEKKLLRSRAR